MLAKLVALALLALAVVDLALADITPEAPPPDSHKFRTIEVRSIEGMDLLSGPKYFIPSGSCNAVLYSTELCGRGLITRGLEVSVSDNGANPRVVIEKGLEVVRITRRGTCVGRANIDLKLSCLRQKHSRSRSRLPVPSHDVKAN